MRTVCFITLLVGLPVFGAVDQEWKSVYNEAVKTAALKQFVVAEALYVKALRMAEIFGANDQRVATTVQGRAQMFWAEKKLTEAEDDARRALTIYAVEPGEKSLEYGRIQLMLAGILMDAAKYQPALLSVQRALPILEQNLGPQSAEMTDGTCLLGDAFLLLKRYASAEPPLRRCADLRMEDGGVATAEFGEAANSLATVFYRLGKLGEADRYFTYAEHIREQALGVASPQLADTLEVHAQLLRQMGREVDAKKNERLATSIRALTRKK